MRSKARVLLKIYSKVKDNWSYMGIALFLMIVLGYVIMKGENIYIQVHDNLDSNFVWLKMLKDNHLFFQTNVTVPFLGGISRNYLYSEWKAYSWLYMIFPAFIALVIGWFGKILISVAGFIFLGKLCYKNYEKKKHIIIWCGFLYGILPNFPTCAFSFASLPFLLGVLILLFQGFRWKYMIILLFYPLFSDFSLFGIFICGFLLVFFLLDWMVEKKPKWQMLLAIIFLSVGYIFTEWRLFYTMLFSGEATIRETFFQSSNVNILKVVKESLDVLIYGQYHCGSLHTYIVLPVCFFYTIFLNVSYGKNCAWKSIFTDKYNWLIAWIGFNTIVYGLDQFPVFHKMISHLFPPLSGFQFARTVWFSPLLWYLAFMIALCRMKKKVWLKYGLCMLATIILCLKPEIYNPIYRNIVACVYETIKGREYTGISYEEFYSENLFKQIKEEIGYQEEWSIAFGMHPAILEYNGIATLDGYLSYYSLDYKKRFRALIEPELEIDEVNKNYFDNWGGRAYIFSNEISYGVQREMEKDSAMLLIDPVVFQELGGRYVFSRVEIVNISDLGLKEVGRYEKENSPYKIYVYEVG